MPGPARSPRIPISLSSWHTVGLVLFVLATAVFQSSRMGHLQNHNFTNRIAVYSFTICFELLLLSYVWFLGILRAGIQIQRRNRRKMAHGQRRLAR
jgi:hypothetical protein